MTDERWDTREEWGWPEFPPGWAEYKEARDRWLASRQAASAVRDYSAAATTPESGDARLAAAR